MTDPDVEALLEAPYKPKEAGDGSPVANRDRSDDDSDSKRKKHKKKRSRHSRSRSRSPRRRRSSSPRRRRSRSPRRRRRSRSRSPRRSRDYGRYRDRYDGGRRRSHVDSPSKDASPEPEKGSPQPDLTPEEKDARTVLVMQLGARVTSRDLIKFFTSSCGKITDCKLISDKNSRRPKGIAYVEFREIPSVHKAVNMSGQKIHGIPVIVQPSMAEKNRAAEAAARLAQPATFKRVYVGSLHFNINEHMLRAVFEPFGHIESVTLIRDETGRSKGYGFIEYSTADSAKRAMEQLNGFELAGRAIKVGQVTEKGETAMVGSLLEDDDLEGGGIGMTSSGRAALMAKLSEGHKAGLSVPSSRPQAAAPVAQAPANSPCFMLTNMFDPETEQDPHWDSDIQDDVLEECNKYGSVVHIYVDKNSKGTVYVKCQTPSCSAAACKSLNGRFFAGKQISAQFVPEANYHTLFPAAMMATTPIKPSAS